MKSLWKGLILFFIVWISFSLGYDEYIETRIVTVDGQTKMECGDYNSTVTVLDVTVAENATHCDQSHMVKHIRDHFRDFCDGKQNCSLLMDEEDKLFRIFGNFDLSYSCNRSSLDCGFVKSFCDWELTSTGSCEWKRFYNNEYQWFIEPEGSYGYAYLNTTISTSVESCLKVRYNQQETNGTLNLFINGDAYFMPSTEFEDTFTKHINETGFLNITFGVECRQPIKVFIIDVSLVHGNCSGTKEYHQTCLNYKQNVNIKECLSGNVKFNDNSFKFFPENKNCSPIYRNISTSLPSQCTDTDSKNYCSLNLTDFVKKQPECFIINMLIVNYTCQALSLPSTESSTSIDKNVTIRPKMVTTLYTAIGMGGGGAIIVFLVVLLVFCWCKRLSKANAVEKLTPNIEIWPVPQPYDEIGLDNIQGNATTSRYQEIDVGCNKDITESDGVVRKVANQTTTINSIRPAYDEIELDSDVSLKSANWIDNSHSTLQSNLPSGTDSSKNYVILDPKETGFNRLVQGIEHEATLTSGKECIKDDTNVKHQKINDTDKTGKSLYKVDDKIIYSHAIDNVYDKAGYNVQTNKLVDNYDHVVRTKTVDT